MDRTITENRYDGLPRDGGEGSESLPQTLGIGDQGVKTGTVDEGTLSRFVQQNGNQTTFQAGAFSVLTIRFRAKLGAGCPYRVLRKSPSALSEDACPELC